jgi:hypothetical protein
MNADQVKRGTDLLQKISAMELIEDRLNHESISRVQLYIDDGVSFSIYKGDGGQFVIEKMIEAGLPAATTVRANAQDDLDKL